MIVGDGRRWWIVEGKEGSNQHYQQLAATVIGRKAPINPIVPTNICSAAEGGVPFVGPGNPV
jgi:hypothetical protein